MPQVLRHLPWLSFFHGLSFTTCSANLQWQGPQESHHCCKLKAQPENSRKKHISFFCSVPSNKTSIKLGSSATFKKYKIRKTTAFSLLEKKSSNTIYITNCCCGRLKTSLRALSSYLNLPSFKDWIFVDEFCVSKEAIKQLGTSQIMNEFLTLNLNMLSMWVRLLWEPLRQVMSGLPMKATAGRLRHRRTIVFLNSPISEAV